MELAQCTCHLLFLLCLFLQGCCTLPSEQSNDDSSIDMVASSTGQQAELLLHQSGTKLQSAPQESARIFFNALGDIISSVPFLPIEINIPDTISQFVEYVGSWFSGNSQGEGSQEETLQRVLVDGILSSLFPKESSKKV